MGNIDQPSHTISGNVASHLDVAVPVVTLIEAYEYEKAICNWRLARVAMSLTRHDLRFPKISYRVSRVGVGCCPWFGRTQCSGF